MGSFVKTIGAVTYGVDEAEWGSLLRVRGDLGPDAADAMLADVMSVLRDSGPPAAVCDYREADVCIGARRILRAQRQSGVQASWATALVVAPAHLEVWRQYAHLQNASGSLRGVFLCYEDGLRWAKRQAALKAAQLNWIERVQRQR